MPKREQLATLALKFAVIRAISGSSIASIRLSSSNSRGWGETEAFRIPPSPVRRRANRFAPVFKQRQKLAIRGAASAPPCAAAPPASPARVRRATGPTWAAVVEIVPG